MDNKIGYKLLIKGTEISKEDRKELDKIISMFLVEKGYDAELHRIGHCDFNFNEIWKDCKSLSN